MEIICRRRECRRGDVVSCRGSEDRADVVDYTGLGTDSRVEQCPVFPENGAV